jgi:hypothetical protein
MYIVLIAWLYVALMMAIAEANSPIGSVWEHFSLLFFTAYYPWPSWLTSWEHPLDAKQDRPLSKAP